MMKRFARGGAPLASACLLFCTILSTAVDAQTPWRPEKTVEIIVGTGAGGQNDVNARLMAKTLQELKLIQVPAVVMNKTGGNQVLSVVYLNQHAGDAHYLLYSTATVFTNQLAGVAPQHYKELTPIALLMVDHTVITVKADSPLKTMRDLVDRLKADAESISFGVSARGGPNHLAVGQAVRSAGIDPRKLKLVVFKTNADSITAMMGGHIQAVVSSVSSAVPQVQAGNARMLAVAAPQRGGGVLANVATMREQGIEARGISNWRVVWGAKGITPAQSAFWADAYSKIVATPEWKQQLDAANLDSKFMRGKELGPWLDGEYEATRAAMVDLGIAK